MKLIKHAAAGCIAALFSAAAGAATVDWQIAGPGILNNVSDGSNSILSYDLHDSGYETQSWLISGIAPEDGTYSFLWNYTGLHSWFAVTVGLTTSTGATLVNAYGPACCDSPSNGFDYSGGFTFYDVKAGDSLGFTASGSNYDYSQLLIGKLLLTPTDTLFTAPSSPVPEADPASMFAVGMALAGFAVTRRRRRLG
ncbi:PEP-CTERM sorting domain-containing protein [Derxia lacustris]|uniref:PEP-CTERM sorting domain-containing protein n=1 Tax=Derxia lacustris TaxID=764842 RepID=UPI000A1706CB|nr:PEP-CTERM sorting domain-containing protein [Derxia lacustris]